MTRYARFATAKPNAKNQREIMTRLLTLWRT
jgi:hypothetical protein